MRYQLSVSVLVLAALSPMTTQAQQLAVSHTPTATASQQRPNAMVQPTGKPVARVNGAVLTDRDLLREMYTMFPYARQHNGQVPPELEPQIRQGALQMIVFEELVYQEAVRRQMTIAPAKLKAAEADFRSQFSGADQYKQFLNSEFHGSQNALDDKIRRSLLIDTMLKAEVDAKSTVSLAETKAYYDKNPARFQYPEAFAIQTISFLPPQKPTPANLKEQRQRAEDALKQAKATANYEQFGMLSEKISEDDYRVMMGDHKAVDRAKLAPQVVQALLAMKAGEVTDIIQVDQAFTIIRLNQHIIAGKMKFADVKDSLQKELQKKKLNDVRAALDQRLRKTAKVEEL
ncbi:MAG TPA: peptidylprolyl isomerase [Terriglobales bacterium]|nr:peptidylprolyl isomerase [Terriglobales bacterium]